MADLETPAKSGAAFGWTICCQSWKTLAFSVVVELLHVINSTVSLFSGSLRTCNPIAHELE